MRGELDFFGVIQIPIFFRRDKGGVRLDETDTEKERFALQFPQRGDGGIGGLAVLQCVIRHYGCLGHGPNTSFRVQSLSAGFFGRYIPR